MRRRVPAAQHSIAEVVGLTIPLVLWANGMAASTTHEEMQFPDYVVTNPGAHLNGLGSKQDR